MKKEMQGNAPAGAVYGMGFIGAVIYFIVHATGFWMGLLGILKAKDLWDGPKITPPPLRRGDLMLPGLELPVPFCL